MQKDNLSFRLKEYELTECHVLFRALFREEMQNWREANDTATAEDVLRNQGAIACIRKLLKLTAPKLEQDRPTHDGGYGS